MIDWALSNSGRLNLKATRLTGVDEWLPGYYDYHIGLRFNDREVFGRGTDRDEPRAFLKAVSEAVERISCQGLAYPWATAVHSDPVLASRSAYRELLGMDRALCHHFTGAKLRPLEKAVLAPGIRVGALEDCCDRYGIALRLFEMRPAADSFVAAAFGWPARSGVPPGVLSGYGCSGTLREAAQQAVIECVRKIGPIFLENIKPKEDMAELEKKGGPWWHVWKMSQESAGLNYLKTVLAPSAAEEVSFAEEDISQADAGFREITEFKKYFPEMPCVVMQAYSDKLILPQFGRPAADAGTLQRLRAFNGERTSVELSVPHMYG